MNRFLITGWGVNITVFFQLYYFYIFTYYYYTLLQATEIDINYLHYYLMNDLINILATMVLVLRRSMVLIYLGGTR